MNAHEAPRKMRRLTSESLAIRSGPIGGKIDGRSAEGRFLAKCEAELTAQLALADAAVPTFTQRMLIRRAARALLRIELLDEKMAAGSWTDHDARTYGGLNNAVRLFMKEIAAQAASGGKAKAKASDLSAIVGRHKASAP
jgi:hypothetical protein